ncbi:hypothetical protein VTK73DRAFT_5984 [Phialemonium thermophilum]|uniref:Peptidase S8/S53 domain-containing protein n=1 Tax=Phialemonium thermophilum TaxID=223376 RepID=A0ABR3V0B3_9PEZI
MAGVIVGSYSGVNKNARLVSVRRGSTIFSVVQSTMHALDYHLAAGGGLPGILNLSLRCEFRAGPTAGVVFPATDPWPRVLSFVEGANMVVTSAAGNEAGFRIAESSPQKYGDRASVIVVGNCDKDGFRDADSTFRDDDNVDRLTLYAPGTDMFAPDIGGDNLYDWIDGTSPATALVSGVLSLLFAQTALDASQIKARLVQESVALKGLAIWPGDHNGVPHPRVALPAPYVSTCDLGTGPAPTATLKEYANLGLCTANADALTVTPAASIATVR